MPCLRGLGRRFVAQGPWNVVCEDLSSRTSGAVASVIFCVPAALSVENGLCCVVCSLSGPSKSEKSFPWFVTYDMRKCDEHSCHTRDISEAGVVNIQSEHLYRANSLSLTSVIMSSFESLQQKYMWWIDHQFVHICNKVLSKPLPFRTMYYSTETIYIVSSWNTCVQRMSMLYASTAVPGDSLPWG